MNIEYYLPDVDNLTRGFSEDAMTRLHMGRSAIALFILAFFTIFIAFWTGIAGCWRRSPGNITATAILMLLACLLSAGAMGLWHGVEYYEKERIVGEEFYQQWNNVLQKESELKRDWSFVLAWISVGTSFISSILFMISACCVRGELDIDIDSQNMHYILPGRENKSIINKCNHGVLRDATITGYDWSFFLVWAGVGFSFVSAVLFSGAAVCLRSERIKEETVNMQYLMPVYPQKQQYAYPPPGYPPAAYAPGPPYYHGSQYGPYNY
ncbi:hypothetical protein O3M35_002053 [Rhynocoris fuscipes]|uniref:Uncharacterized protein n=1 Tax=Rhynocoris fuscipes TaxID=488301 RepID=A0AAW1CR40_9HEMI